MSRIALVQMASTADLNDNLKQARHYLELAKKDGAEMVVFPENWLTLGMTEQDASAIKEDYNNGPIQKQLAAWATEFEIWIVAGTIPLCCDASEKYTSTCLVFDTTGAIKARYDKMHLFDVYLNESEYYQESEKIVAGSELAIFDSPIGKIGLGICYDLRFPELFRALSEKGVEVLIIPSAFTIPTGKLHWEILNRVRALENLAYVVAVNQLGKRHNGHGTYGHSIVVDPWGEVIAQLKDEPGLLMAEIELEHLKYIRERFPALSHRKMRSEL